jgi:xylan 1,4-beta-xylosidase
MYAKSHIAWCFALVTLLWTVSPILAESRLDRPAVEFTSFRYEGIATPPAPTDQHQFLNPILSGFHPDPSLCRVGDEYYLVNSTFSWFPGVPIFRSKDLVNWDLIGHVLDRPSQLNLDGRAVSEGIFAPTIRYHDGTFYMITTGVGTGGNFYVTATNPAGPWSDPHWLHDVNGIDPSFFWDDDGRAYIVHNGAPPDDKPLYSGHRAIWLHEFDFATGACRTGSEKIIVNGGTNLADKPIWIEGPHLFKRNNFYYLCAAQGGTGPQHSQVIFRAKNIWGPYQPLDHPILTQRDLPNDRPNPITCTGHADIFETQTGDWWAVFLACRPYEGVSDRTNIGRETFLLPVKWENDWPTILPEGTAVPSVLPRPALPAQPAAKIPQHGSFTWVDEFDSEALSPVWNFLRTPRDKWYSLTDKPGSLLIIPRPVDLGSKENPSLIARRQQHANFVASTSLSLDPTTQADAGLVAFQNEKHYFFLGMRSGEVFVERADGNTTAIVTRASIPTNVRTLELQITAAGKSYSFSYRAPAGAWTQLLENADASILSTQVAGGFVGSYIGLFARTSKLDELRQRSSQSTPAADQPIERRDPNSQAAHQQLLQKARTGHIDIYFEGDSITRRWGCSDPQYADYYANWKKNFWGWNAADFGWGGDTTQNVLWRLQNGELDNLHPKIIVLLAGTNNVGNKPGDEKKAENISAGLRAIVTLLREKSPGSTLILTAIFPRNDNPAVMPEINAINANLAKLADGKSIRFININDKLADANGKLFDGMMNGDKLHPTIKTYQIWADALKPIFTEILGPPAATDLAPPPTGDPSVTSKNSSNKR